MCKIDLFNGDCLELMKEIPDNSIDMVLCDLPYGVLNKKNESAKWDCQLDSEKLWTEYERITKDNTAIVLFAQGMFTASLMFSKPEWWKYNLIWKKGGRSSGFLNAKKMPLRNHEDICVFYQKQPTYNPQMRIGEKSHSRGNGKHKNTQRCYGDFKEVETRDSNLKYPISVIDIEKEHPQKYHPTQKPVALLEYLIKTYSNEGDTVLDNTMGSGSTGVACVNTNRNFIGIEMDNNYFNTAKERIEEAEEKIRMKQPELF